jgi:ABC-type dipeptide/oligopeptide/nickel transport system ATPase subunit
MDLNLFYMHLFFCLCRCRIPVVIMGETGCGKTRLIKFMCDLQKPLFGDEVQNMILMKVNPKPVFESEQVFYTPKFID